MVHGGPLRGTGASTPLTTGSDTSHILAWESIPAIADCRLQGTAGSPTGAALQRAASLLYRKAAICATVNFPLYKSGKYGIITERSASAKIKYGPVAQLGERSVRIREVESSSLFRSTTIPQNHVFCGIFYYRGRIAFGSFLSCLIQVFVIRYDQHPACPTYAAYTPKQCKTR